MQNFRLASGQKLNNRYRLIRCIGQGGFGITYTAEDETLNQHVVIKEYFPITIVSRDESMIIHVSDAEGNLYRYDEGMKRFLNEAQVLASLFEIPGVVKVLDYFKENGTAYIVMEHIKGVALRTYLERASEEISFERAFEMMQPVMKALEMIHQKGLLHRDINPDNLMVEEDGNIKLLDFGSAREYFLEQDREKTMTILVKNGYAPPEQYESKGKQGPWTDVYALCATIYEMMTGCMPPDSKERQVMDELYIPSTFGVDITAEQEERFIKNGLALDVSERFASIKAMREAFTPEALQEKKKDWKVVAFIAGAVLLAVLLGIWCYISEEYHEQIEYAGNFERGSKEYEAFINYVKDNAMESESYAMEESSLVGWKYTIDEEMVYQIGLPGNDYRLKFTVDDVLGAAQKAGYEMHLVGEEAAYYVYEEPYGSIRTEFNKVKSYESKEGYELEISYDLMDFKVSGIYVSMAENRTDYGPFVLDILHELYPTIQNDEETLNGFYENMLEYEEKHKAGANDLYGYRWEGMLIFFRIYEETGDKIFLKITPESLILSMPSYNW